MLKYEIVGFNFYFTDLTPSVCLIELSGGIMNMKLFEDGQNTKQTVLDC